jgi:hypothetical protein
MKISTLASLPLICIFKRWDLCRANCDSRLANHNSRVIILEVISWRVVEILTRSWSVVKGWLQAVYHSWSILPSDSCRLQVRNLAQCKKNWAEFKQELNRAVMNWRRKKNMMFYLMAEPWYKIQLSQFYSIISWILQWEGVGYIGNYPI